MGSPKNLPTPSWSFWRKSNNSSSIEAKWGDHVEQAIEHYDRAVAKRRYSATMC